jgi:electron transfer flavoprotein beta subunit
MRIAVCVKHAIDETELKIDSSGVPQLSGAAAKMSTFDKNAVEEALRLRGLHAGEVVAVTVGGPDSKKTLKEALAMGADRGVIVNADPTALDTYKTASLLLAAIKKMGPFDMIICSEGSSDTYTGQVPPTLAELSGLPYVGYARKLDVNGAMVRAERSLEDSVEVVESPMPMVASVVSEINEPRYPTLIQIMQASKKPVEELDGSKLPLTPPTTSPSVLTMNAQVSNRKHVMIEGSPDEAAQKLISELVREGVLRR